MQDDATLLTKVSYMYYIDSLSQQEIASLLDLSRSKVSRLLQEAKERGIVQIKIVPSTTRCFAYEDLLKERYGISEVMVVPIYSRKEENILKALGKAGADYLLNNVKDSMTVGIALGRTLNEVANAVQSPQPIQCDVVPITGGIGHVNPGLHPNDICRRIAEGLGGTAYSLYTPAIVSNKQLKEAIIADPMIERVFEKAIEADITIVSVGEVANSTSVRTGCITPEEALQLQNMGVVGDVASWFINANGHVLDVEIHDRVVGPNFAEIREKSKVVLVAGTDLKRDVIAAALRGKLADALITDENVAKYLIDLV